MRKFLSENEELMDDDLEIMCEFQKFYSREMGQLTMMKEIVEEAIEIKNRRRIRFYNLRKSKTYQS